MKKKISILGSTGSIGVNALDIISRRPSDFQVTALAAGRNLTLLKDQIHQFHPEVVSVLREEDATKLKASLGSGTDIKILYGTEGYQELAADKKPQLVLSAMVGAAGLLPTLEAIKTGKDIALANKETLVMAGQIIMEAAASHDVKILPVDSEHSAVFQCLQGQQRSSLHRIILTASGGPFLNRQKEELTTISVQDALAHPNWKMGKKVTIDSASMMNKGLEVIEARWLFGIDFDQIDVMIHPQSIVHSMVEYSDGSILAQMGAPDMRVPIAYALCYPERLTLPDCRLNVTRMQKLEFTAPDMDRFPNLALAYEAGRQGGAMPAILNAANEVAVEKFIDGQIAFTDMPVLIRKTMREYEGSLPHSPSNTVTLEEILKADCWARQKADQLYQGMKRDGYKYSL